MSSPNPMNRVTIEVPPLLISGNGKPITGTSPDTMAMLIKTYRKNVRVILPANRRPNKSLAA